MSLKVSDIMTKNPTSISPSTTLSQAAQIMLDKDISGLPIVDQDKLVGIITEGDFLTKAEKIPFSALRLAQLFGQWVEKAEDLNAVFAESRNKPVSDFVKGEVFTIEPDADIKDVVEMMMTKGVNRIPVEQNGLLVGIVTRRDILGAFANLKV